MDNHAKAFLPVVEKASQDFLKNIQPELKPLDTGHIPLDADVAPMDNSGTRKEGVSRTCKGCDGYAPMPASGPGRLLRFLMQTILKIPSLSLRWHLLPGSRKGWC